MDAGDPTRTGNRELSRNLLYPVELHPPPPAPRSRMSGAFVFVRRMVTPFFGEAQDLVPSIFRSYAFSIA